MFTKQKKSQVALLKLIGLHIFLCFNLTAGNTKSQKDFIAILKQIEYHQQLLKNTTPPIAGNITETWQALLTDISNLTTFIRKADKTPLTLDEKIYIENELNEQLTTLPFQNPPHTIAYFVKLYKFWDVFCRSLLMQSLILESGKKNKDYYEGCLTKVATTIKQNLSTELQKNYLERCPLMIEYLLPIFNQRIKFSSSFDTELLSIFLDQTNLFVKNSGTTKPPKNSLQKILINLEKINADPPTKNKILNIINSQITPNNVP